MDSITPLNDSPFLLASSIDFFIFPAIAFSGHHTVAWDAGQRATGTYFYRFLTEGFQQSRKMLLVH